MYHQVKSDSAYELKRKRRAEVQKRYRLKHLDEWNERNRKAFGGIAKK